MWKPGQGKRAVAVIQGEGCYLEIHISFEAEEQSYYLETVIPYK